MGLLRDWHYVERAVQIPALAELIREALIRALFVRDDRVLPPDLIADLNRVPPVTVKVKEDAEVRKLVRVLNGQESTVSLGLSAEDYHYFRTQLGVGRTREFGVTMRPRTLLTYDWIVPSNGVCSWTSPDTRASVRPGRSPCDCASGSLLETTL